MPRGYMEGPAAEEAELLAEQAALCVARDDAERQEHGEHDTEEQSREERKPEEERAGKGAGVDVHVLGRRDLR